MLVIDKNNDSMFVRLILEQLIMHLDILFIIQLPILTFAHKKIDIF